MSEYDGNYGEMWERDMREAVSGEREREAEHREWTEMERVDRLRRDWPAAPVSAVEESAAELREQHRDQAA